MTISSDSASRRDPWSRVDDGIVSGRLLRAPEGCDVCGAYTSVIMVDGYTLPAEVNPLWKSLIIAHPDPAGNLDVAVQLGVGCGCYAKFHRQVVHVKDSVKRRGTT